jgi:catechol 2,3-dioxygenase-like lactoylglutathione lyase family enzyme
MAHIKQSTTVFVPVRDQDRALAFYVEKLGFEPLNDFEYGDGERWVEVAPPGATMAIALPLGDGGIETRIAFVTDDIDAHHAALRAGGVDVDEAILRAGDPVVRWGGAVLAGVPPMFLLRDPDGNSFLITHGG